MILENSDQDIKFTKKIETFSDAMSLAYKAAAGVGALTTFAYLFLIHFFPSGLTPGEVIFFVFIALAFSFTYFVVILYSAFSALWVAHLLTFIILSPRYCPADLVKQMFEPVPSKFLWWRKFRLGVSRAALNGASWVPKFAKGWALGIPSFLIFSMFAIQAYLSDSVRFTEICWTGLFIGIAVLALLSEDTTSEQSATRAKIRIIGVGFVPLAIICTYLGLIPFLNVVFQGLGIRADNVTVEMADTEAGNIERISELIHRPLIDCRRTQPGKILVHGADILWTGVGDQTLIRLRAHETTKRGVFAAERDNIPEASFNLETKSLHIIKTKPYADPCFDMPSDLLFDTGEYELSAEAKGRLKDVADTVAKQGNPVKLTVRGHSDPRPITNTLGKEKIDNQTLSERRATAVASTLKEQLGNPKLLVVSDGAGSREVRVKCGQGGQTSYELEQCNKPNRRVEVKVTYGRQSN